MNALKRNPSKRLINVNLINKSNSKMSMSHYSKMKKKKSNNIHKNGPLISIGSKKSSLSKSLKFINRLKKDKKILKCEKRKFKVRKYQKIGGSHKKRQNSNQYSLEESIGEHHEGF